MYTRGKPKEGTTRSGATAPCRAQLRRQGASAATRRDTQREQDKISILCGSQNIPPGHLDSPQDMPKHSNFLNRKKLCAQSFPHGTSWQQQWDRELKKTKQVETRFKTRQVQHAPSPDWARSPNCVQFFKSPDSAPSIGFAPFSRGFKSGSARKRGDCCIERNCYEWNICQHKMRKQEKQNKQGKTLREERETTTWITEHGST